jgi:hypothetical protein
VEDVKLAGWCLIVLNVVGLGFHFYENPTKAELFLNTIFEALGMVMLGLIGLLLLRRDRLAARQRKAREGGG